MIESAVAKIDDNAVVAHRNTEGHSVEVEGSSMLILLAQLKHSVGDLALFDDISVEADVDQVGPRAKSHFRFRCYRRSGG